ncbi:hypothetical protein JB92DRAFT_2987921, partial [Gautieria morchelliformis]
MGLQPSGRGVDWAPDCPLCGGLDNMVFHPMDACAIGILVWELYTLGSSVGDETVLLTTVVIDEDVWLADVGDL